MKDYARFLVLVLFLTSLIPLNAQLRVGAIIGTNLASISVDPEPSTEEYSGLAKFLFGAVGDYGFSENFGVRAEFILVGKGAKVAQFGDEANFSLGYIEIPIMARYTFILNSPFNITAMAGPTIGFLTAAKVKGDFGDHDIKDETSGIDFGVTFGIGAEVETDDLPIIPFIELRYCLGFTNVNEEEGESTVKNRGFVIAVGALYPIDNGTK